jgi:dihydroorotase-like cyclic amidohydrolase
MTAGEAVSAMLGQLQPTETVDRLQLVDVWLVDPLTGREGPADLTIENGILSRLSWLEAAGRDLSDARLLLLPGLIDLGAHLGPELEQLETPASATEAASHGGYTSLVGAVSLQALGMEWPHQPLSAGEGEAAEGIAAAVLGLRGVPAEAEAEAVARALYELRDRAAESGPADVAPLHLANLSTSAAAELVAAARAEGLPVSCDVTAQHICMHDGWLGGDRRFSWEAAGSPWSGGPAEAEPYHPATRLDPPLRSAAEAVSLAAAVTSSAVQAISTGHRPRDEAAVALPYGEVPPGISSIETCLPLVLAAVDAGVLPMMTAVRALTSGPAAIAELPSPAVHEGARANLVLVDRGAEWLVDGHSLRSHGRNTPLLGRSLRGRVLLTLAQGTVAWLDEEVAQARREESSVRR